MANLPVPPSYPQLLGPMIDTISGRLGVDLRPGDPTLSVLEAAAHSDFRASMNLMSILAIANLDRATGQTLDYIGASENLPRPGATTANGFVDFSDSRYTKKSTRLYQGASGSIAGSTVLFVEDGTFLANGSRIYIGRGTVTAEGPLTVSSVSSSGSYYTVNLSSATTYYHNPGEEVVLGQGSYRTIPQGTTVAVGASGPAGSQVQYRTTRAAAILDGEVLVQSVPVVASVSGSGGNCGARTITSLPSLPFTGCTVTNRLPITSGVDAFDDDAYRELVRSTRASRSKGTATAIRSAVRGATSSIEGRTVLSSQIIAREGEPVRLVIDDGTGYEESSVGIPYEVLTNSAVGGEQYFTLVYGRPVAKANLQSKLTAPFAIAPGSVLKVSVGGVVYQHDFEAGQFQSVAYASAYEVVRSINSNTSLGFGARTSSSGSKVTLFAKADVNEDLQVLIPASDYVDANTALGFSTTRTYTINLYKNDHRLVKDGVVPEIKSNPRSSWGPVSSGGTLALNIDGVATTVTITDANFTTNGLGFGTVSASNSVASWVSVLNATVPGITAFESDGALGLRSNLGANSRARIAVTGGTIGSAFFDLSQSDVTGQTSDFTLDRNLGFIKLATPLSGGDVLTAGVTFSLPFYESTPPTSLAANAEMWWFVDGDSALAFRLSAGSAISVNTTSVAWGWTAEISVPANTSQFADVAVGDWVVTQDPSLPAALQGAFRIASKIADSAVVIEIPNPGTADASYTLSEGRFSVVRSNSIPQKITIAAGSNFTASSFATAFSGLTGAGASVYRTSQFRVYTNNREGSILLASTNASADLIRLVYGGSPLPHLGGVVSSSGIGTPSFTTTSISSVAGSDITVGSATGFTAGSLLSVGRIPTRYANAGFTTSIATIAGSTITLTSVPTWLTPESVYARSGFAFTGSDQLAVLVDNNPASKRYQVPMGRALRSANITYGQTITVKDYFTGAATYLSAAMGTGFDFKDFAVHMAARVKTHSADNTRTILWRSKRLGADGNNYRISYGYPSAPNSSISYETRLDQGYVDTYIRFGSGAARSPAWTLHNDSRIGVAVTGITGELRTYTTVFNMAVPIGGAVRTKAIAYTNRDPSYVFAPGTNIEGSISGATGTVVSDSNPTPGATDGYLVITTTGTAFEFKDDIVDTSDSNTYAVASSGLYGRVTLTPTRPAGVTDLGLVAGDYIYFDTGAYTGMAGGAKVIVDSTATTITYNDTVTGDASSTQATAFSVDPTGLISGTGGAVVAGDIMYLGGTANTDVDGSNHHLLFNNPVKIASVDANKRHLTATIPVGGPASGVLTWKRVNNAALATFFPLTATTAGALAGTSFASACPVTATSVGTGAGAMSNATYESAELGAATASTYFYPMVDGINWVRSTNTPTVSTDYTFTLKSTISAGLSGSSVDFNHEQIVLVPVTTKNVVDWLNSPAISGLFSASTVANASGLVQIAAKTTGGLGSVKVDGGSANSVAALIAGSVASTGGGTYGLSVATSDAAGLAGGSWVRIQNSLPNTKTAINASTGLTSISGGLVTLSGTPAWTWANTATGIINTTWQVEAQGGFWKWTSGTSFAAAMSGITEGDWVRIGSVSGAALNLGVFRVVRADTANGAFWIENPSGVESYASYDCQFITYDSIVPGDTLIMDSPVWGSVGSWTVTGISASNTSQFTVTGLADSGAVGALGSSSSWVRIVESTPSSMVKQILGIVTDPAVPSLTKITFNGSAIGGEALGTTIVPLDKLKFPSNNSYGLDGYSHTTGLIEEANRIVYGDPQGSYEGVAAAGVGIDITGPVVRHVSVGVAVRASGSQSIATRIQSAVAGIINASPTGQSIAISDIVRAVSMVTGTTSVVVTSPTYALGSDLIPVQPYEKALVTDLSTIQVSFIGE